MRKNLIEKARPKTNLGFQNNPSHWTYKLKGDKITYHFQLERLVRDYKFYTELSDDDFLKHLAGATHFACIISYYKNLSPEETLLDNGIVHELVHLAHCLDGGLSLKNGFQTELKQIRRLFKRLLKITTRS